MTNTRKWWWRAVAWAAVLFALSAREGTGGSWDIPHIDKVAHFVVYVPLGFALARALPGRAALAWGLASFYGVTDEFHQAFVPLRDPSVGDWLADTLGAGVGVLASGALLNRSRRRRGDVSAPTDGAGEHP